MNTLLKHLKDAVVGCHQRFFYQDQRQKLHKSFMSNDENKTQLIKLLPSEWKKPKYASRLRRRQLFFVCGEECFCLSSDDGIVVQALPEEDLFSSQGEADTRIILHCSHVARKIPTTFVIAVRSTDTDLLVLLSKYSQNIDYTILFDTGMGNKRRLLNVSDIVFSKGPELCYILPAFYSFTGCDTTSAFVRIPDATFDKLEQFVCCMYGKPRYKKSKQTPL